MTNKRDDLSLPRIELVLLARYAGSKLPEEEELNREVSELVHGTMAQAKEQVTKARAALRERGLLGVKPAKKGKPPGKLSLTLAGERTLRSTFAISEKLTWAKIRDAHLPALGLKLKPGTAEAMTAQKTLASLMIETLHVQHQLPRGATVNAVCDAMITEALGLPVGAVPSLEWLRAQFLAQKTNLRDAQGTPLDLAKRIVAPKESPPLTKAAMNRILARRWISGQTDHGAVTGSTSGNSTQSTQSTQSSQTGKPSTPQPKPPLPPPVVDLSHEALLKAVHELLPQVDSDGRYGPEKVFVSAIWHGLQRSHRLNGDYSLERFKRWLVEANRKGLLVLARADLIGAMDNKLVAESEIREPGATFHFVVDRRVTSASAERRTNAR